jgi:hypothetical protein
VNSAAGAKADPRPRERRSSHYYGRHLQPPSPTIRSRSRWQAVPFSCAATYEHVRVSAEPRIGWSSATHNQCVPNNSSMLEDRSWARGAVLG